MRIAGGSSHEVMRSSFLWSEVEAESHLQTNGALVGKINERHPIVGSRLDGEVLVDEEGVAHFYGDGKVVSLKINVLIAFGLVDVSCAGTEEDAALVEIVARTDAEIKVIGFLGVIIAHLSAEHEAVIDEIACIGIKSKAELLFAAVLQVQSRQSGAEVFLTLFKLRAGAQGSRQKNENEENLLHHVFLNKRMGNVAHSKRHSLKYSAKILLFCQLTAVSSFFCEMGVRLFH